MAALGTAIEDAGRVRLRLAGGSILLDAPKVSGEGIAGLYGVTHRGSIMAIAEEPRLVRWDEIERVEVPASAVGRGAKWGALIGGAAGIAAAASLDPDAADVAEHWTAEWPEGIALRALAVGASTAAGAILGSAVGGVLPRWKQIAP